MNTPIEKRRATPRRRIHRSEPSRAPHRRPPSGKDAAPSLRGRDRTEARGNKPLPVAQPARPTARPSKHRQPGGTQSRVEAVPTSPETSSPRARPRPRRTQFDVRTAFTIFGFSVAAVLILLFGVDLTMAVPFQRVSLLMDTGYLICGIILAGLSWSCYRDLR